MESHIPIIIYDLWVKGPKGQEKEVGKGDKVTCGNLTVFNETNIVNK